MPFSSRPVLLILCIYVERIVHLLEELFRRATLLAQPFAEVPLAPCPNARRMNRTLRSLLDYSSMCPFPEANWPLRVGGFEVGDEVKTRALRRILRGRMQRLLVMLRDMKLATGAEMKDLLQSHGQGNSGDGYGGSPMTNETAGKLVDALYLRVQSLLGRVHLTG
jgi:hypothetical protein